MGTSERPRALAGAAYTAADTFDAELDTIFGRTWQLVGHRSQVAEHGQMITATVGREPIVVANNRGVVTGFYNVCQHRGHELVAAGTTRASAISCPYHAWVYDLSGRLVAARGADVGSICVPSVRVDYLAGFVFVNLDPDAPPLAEVAPGVEAELLALAPDAADRQLTARLTHEFAANWKVAVENYNECYHCPNVHRSFTTGVVDPATFMITPDRFVIRHAATAIASSVTDDELTPDFVIPSVFNKEVPMLVAAAVAKAAVNDGVCRA